MDPNAAKEALAEYLLAWAKSGASIYSQVEVNDFSGDPHLKNCTGKLVLEVIAPTGRSSLSSWFSGICKECGYNVVVTQPDSQAFPIDDYWWYCSNKKCEKHIKGEHTGDMEIPEWVFTGYEWKID
jgi:hypothetical protein